MDIIEITEGIASVGGVDPAAGRIAGVKLLGEVSRNGRRYAVEAMRESVRQYEGAPIFADHAKSADGRSIRDLLGAVRNPRYDESKRAVYGDLELLKSHPAAAAVFEAAQRMPERFGMSHVVEGVTEAANGGAEQVVTKIARVRSVDVVTDPATTRGLYESAANGQQQKGTSMEVKDLTEATLASARPDLVSAIAARVKTELSESAEAKAKDDKIKALTEEVATLAEAAKKSARKAAIEEKLSKSGLPAKAITDVFRGQLAEAADDKAIDALIEDRKAIVGTGGGGSTAKAAGQHLVEGRASASGDLPSTKDVASSVLGISL